MSLTCAITDRGGGPVAAVLRCLHELGWARRDDSDRLMTEPDDFLRRRQPPVPHSGPPGPPPPPPRPPTVDPRPLGPQRAPNPPPPPPPAAAPQRTPPAPERPSWSDLDFTPPG